MKTPERSRESVSPTVQGTRAALVLAIIAAFGCEPTKKKVNYAKNKDIDMVTKCLEEKVGGLIKKACDPAEAKDLVKLAKEQCDMKTPKKYGKDLFTKEGEFSPKQREGHIRAAINRICRDGTPRTQEKNRGCS